MTTGPYRAAWDPLVPRGLEELARWPLPPTSVVITTRNRCPFPPESGLARFNPLRTCLATLVAQRATSHLEIIVVDDQSSDHTGQILAQLSVSLTDAGIRLVPLTADRRLGPAWGRRLGTEHATHEVVVYVDDDCLVPPWFVFAGATALLRERRCGVAAVGLPCYARATKPRRICRAREIGRLSIPQARWLGNFDCFPVERWPRAPTAAPKDATLRCIEVDWCLMGAAVAWRSAILDGDAFPAYQREAYWSEAFEACTALRRAGQRILFCPDPRFGVCHLKFGTRGRYAVDQADRGLWLPVVGASLGELIALAEQERPESGLRASPEQFFFTEILGYFAFFLRHDVGAAAAWALREYQRFVRHGHAHHRSVSGAPPAEDLRCAIWRRAIGAGLDLGERYFGLRRDDPRLNNLKTPHETGRGSAGPVHPWRPPMVSPAPGVQPSPSSMSPLGG